MSCSRHRDSVVLLADGELTEDAAREVQSHVDGCETCRATLGELESLRELLTPAAATNPTMAENRFWRSFEADLALRVTRNATPFWRRAIVLPVPAAVTMGVAVCLLGAMVLQLRGEVNRLARHTASLEAKVIGEEADVVFASPVSLDERLALMHANKTGRGAPMKPLLPVPMPAPKVRAPHPQAFKFPAPHATPETMENLRFVDSSSGDFY